MALREELESQEPACHSAYDWIDLARSALSAPIDQGYAGELIQRAELKCQSVSDYLTLANFVAYECDDMAYGKDLFHRAESVSNTPEEAIQVCESVVGRTGNLEHGREILEKALRRPATQEQLVALANCANSTVKSETLLRHAILRLTESAKDIQTYLELCTRILGAGHRDLSLRIFRNGSRLCREMTDLIRYAEAYWDLYNDREGALGMLGDAETDCQSTREFVALASAYRRLFEDEERLVELMELAIEYAVSTEDQLDLADGYWRELQDYASASQIYARVLAEINDSTNLRELAEHIGVKVKDLALCRQYLERAAAAAGSFADLMACSQLAHRLLADPNVTLSLLSDASDRFDSDAELAELIDAAVDFDLPRLASTLIERLLYQTDLSGALRCIDTIHTAELSASSLRQAVEAAKRNARTTDEVIQLARLLIDKIDDPGLSRELLESAEGMAADPAELKAVAEEVARFFPYDNSWKERLRTSLALREANAARYANYTKLEAQVSSVSAMIDLSHRVDHDLGDRNLIRRLLLSAESIIKQNGFSIQDWMELFDAVNVLLGDDDWLQRIAEVTEKHAVSLQELVVISARVKQNLASEWALSSTSASFRRFESKLLAGPNPHYSDFLRLSHAVHEFTDDSSWAGRLLDQAATYTKSPLEMVMVAMSHLRLGDESSAVHFRESAIAACDKLTDLKAVIRLLRRNGLGESTLKEAYIQGGARFKRPRERLSWAEGIIPLFNDRAWAHREYSSLKKTIGLGLDTATYASSFQLRLQVMH